MRAYFAIAVFASLVVMSFADQQGSKATHDTTIQHFPSQVSVVSSTGQHNCSGSVIGDSYVLTAAQCVQGSASDYRVQTNNGNRYQDVSTYPIMKITTHPHYNLGRGTFPNDIAVIKVYGNIMDSLPKQRLELAIPTAGDFAKRHCSIAGWGENAQLQEATGEILPYEGCSSSWGRNYNPGSQICIDANIAEAGGPIVCGKTLVGVSSWGDTDPTVYTRVSSYYDWIKWQMV